MWSFFFKKYKRRGMKKNQSMSRNACSEGSNGGCAEMVKVVTEFQMERLRARLFHSTWWNIQKIRGTSFSDIRIPKYFRVTKEIRMRSDTDEKQKQKKDRNKNVVPSITPDPENITNRQNARTSKHHSLKEHLRHPEALLQEQALCPRMGSSRVDSERLVPPQGLLLRD